MSKFRKLTVNEDATQRQVAQSSTAAATKTDPSDRQTFLAVSREEQGGRSVMLNGTGDLKALGSCSVAS
ncbi:hypothetical protein NL676_029315 [Syzygium grande]|nr:hypothetical protein NL676_029315 [Syzygium grande]